jgi:peptide/nickel transport system ATP-binding protein
VVIEMAGQLRGFGVQIATRGDRGGVVTALDDVDLDIVGGSVTALVGESGCGKSLVAMAMCGLLPPGSTTRGDLSIDGADITGAGESRWRGLRGRVVGVVPQSPATSFTPVRTVGSQISEVVKVLGSDRSAAELVALAGLPADALGLFPHQLSGGMAQRAAIATALAGDPTLLIADEPTSALDPELAELVWKLLRSIADDGAAVLVITHEIKSLIASDICNSIAVMRTGRTIVQDSPAGVLSSTDDYVAKLFSGVPR